MHSGEEVSFNPRTREGCDSTNFKGVAPWQSFNPRTREGCDLGIAAASQVAWKVSIHAPVRGATRAKVQHRLADGFQSTHP